jgi:hypothetical protein
MVGWGGRIKSDATEKLDFALGIWDAALSLHGSIGKRY